MPNPERTRRRRRLSGNSGNAQKSNGYATDWDPHCATQQGRDEGFSPEGLTVEAYDIYSGEASTDTSPRAHADTPDTFLGKGGSIQDRHSSPAASLMGKINSVIKQLQWEQAC